MSDPECAVGGCARSRNGGKGYCKMHYARLKRTGSVGGPAPKKCRESLEEIFLSSTRKSGECIEWTGAASSGGYGIASAKGMRVPAHRYSWERDNGAVPDGMVIDHMCWNRLCVNTDHLRIVTQGQNLQNRAGPMPGSKSGVRNVSWASREKRWVAKIKVNGKHYLAGYFTTIAEADVAATELRREMMPWSIK